MDALLDMESSLLTATEPTMPDSPLRLADASPAPQGPKESGTGVPPVIPAPQGAFLERELSSPPLPQGGPALPEAPTPQLAQSADTPALSSAAANSLALAARPEVSEAPTLQNLSREALESATGGPRALPRHNPYDAGLPEASSILSLLNSPAPLAEAPLVQVAQAGNTPPPAAPEAQSALEAAARLRDSGAHADALLAYVRVMENYPNDPAAVKQADRGIVQYVKDLTAGTLQREQVAAFETTLETWTPANAQAGYGALTYLGRRAEELQDGGAEPELYRDYARRTINLAARVIALDPHHYKQLGIADYYFVSARRLAPVERHAAMQALAETAPALPPSMARLATNFVLANSEAQMNNNRGLGALYRSALLADAREPFVAETFESPSVEPWLKGMLGNVIGGAHWIFGDYDAAIAVYEDTLLYLSEAGSTREMVELSIAQAKADKFRQDPQEAVKGYNDFLAKFPEGKRAPEALLLLASVYMTAGDYSGASALYAEVLQRWPDSADAATASSELTYINTHLSESVPVAEIRPLSEEERAVAMRCGPEALALLLDSGASVDELALLAGTDHTGTSMLGLIEAASSKGFALSGVAVNAVDDLTPPFIAYVNGDHFVVVTEIGDKAISIVDRAEGARAVSRSDFGALWSGMALVPGDPVAERLELAALRAARGGSGSGGSPGDEDPPCKVENHCSCRDDGDGDGPPSDGGPPPKGGPVGSSVDLPGAPSCPISSVAARSPGVSPEINVFETALKLRERDLSIDVTGALKLTFARTYLNEKGWHRGEYTSTAKPWMNNVGSGWTHNLNRHLRTPAQSTPDTVTIYDNQGSARVYELDSTAGGYNIYTRHAKAQSWEKANVLKRDTTSLAYTLEEGGLTYEFSATTTDSYRFARLESIKDQSGNEITLTYDGAVGSGKLTTATSPTSDYTLNFTYTGALIAKVELKKSSTVLNSVEFAYVANELVEVEDHAAKTVEYEYDTFEEDSEEYGRYITKITGKAGQETDFAWSWNTGGLGEATKIEVTNEDGLLTTYDRSISTNVATITNHDGATLLTKFVNTPASSTDVARSKYHDYYTGVSTYERWEHVYDGNNFLTKIIAPTAVDYWTMTYDAAGRITSKKFGTGPVEEWGYDGEGRAILHTDGAGIETEFEYDGNGRLEKMTHPAYHADGYRYEYDGDGNLTKEITPLGTETTYTYDALGRLEEVVQDPGGLAITTGYVYDDLGNRVEKTDPRGEITEYEYGATSCGGCGGGANLEKVTDALGHETEWIYNADGLLETTIDASGIETDYAYDAMGRVTTITHPAGSAITSTMTYNKLGQLTSRTNFGGGTTSYAYDHMGRATTETDAVGDVVYAYNILGQLVTVTDSLGHTTTYTYDTAFRLVELVDEIGKETHYFYDAYGRQESVGAGSAGTVDPTTYNYDPVTGQLASVEYGSSTYTASYEYDGEGRLVKLTDWIDAVDGLRYGHDAVGRLETITDYDDSVLTYTYDDGGNVLSMVDYHGNTTSYTYNDIGQLDTLTAPGSKVWDYTYDAGNRLSRVDIPNGMHTEYTYDASGRQDSIHHKDGATAKQGFDYTFDNGGNITRIDHEDGSYWAYDYDGRERLIEAIRGNAASPTIEATYEYTYDDADNMLTKTVPWYDDFQDGNLTGWSGNTANFSVVAGVLKNTLDASFSREVYLSETDADHDLRFNYIRYSSTGTASHTLRYTDNNNRLSLEIAPNGVLLRQADGGVQTTLGSLSTTVAEDTWYQVRVIMNGGSVKVYWGAVGGNFNEIFSATTTELTTTRAAWFRAPANSEHGWDDIQLIAGTRSTVETFTYNDANEQTTHVKNGVTTTMTYDDWGRLEERDDGSHTATYGYRYGGKLHSVASDFPGEGSVTYETGGDGKRRSRVAGAEEVWYNWDKGLTVVSEENHADGSSGALQRTYLGRNRAHVDGTSPSAGTWKYYSNDHILNTTGVWNQDKTTHTTMEYTPYGENYAATGSYSEVTRRYTGHDWDERSGLYFSHFRYYSADMGRWLGRDPLGMVDGPNVYAYVQGRVVNYSDYFGGFMDSCSWGYSIAVFSCNAVANAATANAALWAGGASFACLSLGPVAGAACVASVQLTYLAMLSVVDLGADYCECLAELALKKCNQDEGDGCENDSLGECSEAHKRLQDGEEYLQSLIEQYWTKPWGDDR